MALLADDIQQIILEEVGDTPSGLLATRIEDYWASYADKALVAPRLQELYTKRRCLDVLLNAHVDEVDFNTDGALSLHLDQRTGHRRAMRQETEREIGTIEARARAVRPPAVKPLTHTEIETLPEQAPVLLDANSQVYRGDPYFGAGGQPLGAAR